MLSEHPCRCLLPLSSSGRECSLVGALADSSAVLAVLLTRLYDKEMMVGNLVRSECVKSGASSCAQ